jgi:hypothetical protein
MAQQSFEFLPPSGEGRVSPDVAITIDQSKNDSNEFEFQPPSANEASPDALLNPLLSAGAGAGAGYAIGAGRQMLGTPSTAPTVAQIMRAASIASQKVADRTAELNIAQERLISRAGGAENLQQLTQDWQQSQAALQQAESDLMETRSLLRQVNNPPASEAAPAVEGLAAQRKMAGATGAYNTVMAMSGEEVPHKLALQATSMEHHDPFKRGAYDIMDINAAQARRQGDLGMGNYKLVGKGENQMILPPAEAARAEMELARVAEEQSAAQARAMQMQEWQKADLERQIKEGQLRKIAASKAESQARRDLGSKQRAQTTGVASATRTTESLSDKLQRAREILSEAQGRIPSWLSRPFIQAGEFIAGHPKTFGTIGGLGAGLQGYEAYDELSKAQSPMEKAQAYLDAIAAAGSAAAVAPYVPAPARGIGALLGAGIPAGRYIGENLMPEPRSFKEAGRLAVSSDYPLPRPR